MNMYRGEELQLRWLLTTTLDGGECSTSRHDRFTPREITDLYLLKRTLGGLQSRSEPFLIKERLMLLAVFDPWAVHPVASRDTARICSVCPLISPLALGPGSAMTQPVGRYLPTTERQFRSLEAQWQSAWTKWRWCLSQFLRLCPGNHHTTIAPCSSVTARCPTQATSLIRHWAGHR